MNLADAAKLAAPMVQRRGPRPNAEGLARLMVLIAQDVARYNQTGRTSENTTADAITVMFYILDGGAL